MCNILEFITALKVHMLARLLIFQSEKFLDFIKEGFANIYVEEDRLAQR